MLPWLFFVVKLGLVEMEFEGFGGGSIGNKCCYVPPWESELCRIKRDLEGKNYHKFGEFGEFGSV